MALGVPVKVTVALAPIQIVLLDAIVAVGKGVTVMVALPVCGWLQLGVLEVAMLTNVKTVVAV
jgi:hypothetical protein